jgi:CRAL/TRIO domain
MLVRIQNIKPSFSSCLFKDCCTALKAIFETLGEIEEIQIRGMNYILDVSGITLEYLKIASVETLIRAGKHTEKLLTGRHKSIHIVNVPPALSYLVNLFMAYVPQKFRDRLVFHKNFDTINFVKKESLPKEHGGSISMAEMCSKSSL